MRLFNIEKETHLTDCRKYVFSFVSLGILVLILYSNTFHASWHFDDEQNIQKRDSIHLTEFSLSQIRGTLYNEAGHFYRPVANFSLALNYYFSKNSIVGYHAVNIIIHFIASSFLFLFIYHVLRLPRLKERYGKQAYFIAFLSSVLWATNPLQTQAVTYIVQRMASMAGMFFIMSMYFYIHGRVSNHKHFRVFAYLACAITGLLACGSKENAAMLPFSIILLDLFLIQGLSKRSVTRVCLLILLCTLVPLILILLTRGLSVFDPEQFLGSYSSRNFTLIERLLTEPRIIIFYISLLLYPVPSRLCVIHDISVSHGLFNPSTTILSILFILVIIAAALAVGKKHPLISYCILFFFLNHLIESSILPLELVFEHRNYLPSMLFFVPIAILFCKALHAFSHKPAMYGLITAFVIFFIISNGHGTFIRNAIWKTDESLWMNAADKYPNSRRAHHNLGYYYERVHHFDKALKHYNLALALPQASYGNKRYLTHANLGLLYERMGERKEAEKQLRISIATAPGFFYPAHNNLGSILLHEKRYKEALKIFVNALGYAPNNWELHHNLGVLLLRTDQPNEAIAEFKKALDLNGNADICLEYLGVSFKKAGDLGKAVYYLRQVVSKKPKSLLARLHLAEIYLLSGNEGTAERIVAEALSLIPPKLVFSELQAYIKKTVLRELPNKSRIIPLIEKYYLNKIDGLRDNKTVFDGTKYFQPRPSQPLIETNLS